METLIFTATEAGFHEDENCLIAGVVSYDATHYVTFQRGVEGSQEDWGIHFEFDDQINGEYECIRKCNLSRRRLIVELTGSIDRQKKISSVDVELAIADDGFGGLVRILRRIFRDRKSLLTINEEQ